MNWKFWQKKKPLVTDAALSETAIEAALAAAISRAQRDYPAPAVNETAIEELRDSSAELRSLASAWASYKAAWATAETQLKGLNRDRIRRHLSARTRLTEVDEAISDQRDTRPGLEADLTRHAADAKLILHPGVDRYPSTIEEAVQRQVGIIQDRLSPAARKQLEYFDKAVKVALCAIIGPYIIISVILFADLMTTKQALAILGLNLPTLAMSVGGGLITYALGMALEWWYEQLATHVVQFPKTPPDWLMVLTGTLVHLGWVAEAYLEGSAGVAAKIQQLLDLNPTAANVRVENEWMYYLIGFVVGSSLFLYSALRGYVAGRTKGFCLRRLAEMQPQYLAAMDNPTVRLCLRITNQIMLLDQEAVRLQKEQAHWEDAERKHRDMIWGSVQKNITQARKELEAAKAQAEPVIRRSRR